jgi:hypothetical protein
MNQKRIEQLIPKAMAYIEKNSTNSKKGFKHEKKNGIDKVYSGYLNAFGPTVITSGLLRSVSFYDNDTKKQKVTNMLFSLLKSEKLIKTQKDNLADFLSAECNFKDIALKDKIFDVTIACKLAIKTFDLVEE